MSSDDHHHHHKHGVLGKLHEKVSAAKEHVVEAIRDRTHSTSSDRRSSISSNTSVNLQSVAATLHGETVSLYQENNHPHAHFETTSLASGPSMTSLNSTASVPPVVGPRHTIDQLAINMGFGGLRPTPIATTTTTASQPPLLPTLSTGSSASLVNSANPVFQPVPSTPTSSVRSLDLTDSFSLHKQISQTTDNDVQERTVVKIDPDAMEAKPTVEVVPKDPVRRAAMLLSGPKFRLNSSKIPGEKLPVNTDIIFSVAIAIGLASLVIALWKPISSYFSGVLVGCLFAGALFYIFVRTYINAKAEETGIEEWVEFPALEAMLSKCDKEDKDTNINVTGASIAFQRYDADRDEDFVRYPCDVRLDGYRLIIHLASKAWGEDKKADKEPKFIGYREYLVKEARMMLVPEATLTRAKYWMNDYPIIIQDLQVLDKQIHNKQLLEKSKLDTNDFFSNTATILSIWFETCPQKEEWFHKLSLVLRKGKEDIERANSLIAGSTSSLASAGSTPSLYRRLAQTDSDTELVPNPVPESEIRAAINETKANAEALEEKAKVLEPENEEIDSSGTHRAAARKSKKTPNEASLQKVLQSPECLDEAAITINLLTRRLLCDMFDVPIFTEMIKTKVEMKLKEVALKILKDLRVTSIDIGNTFPVILKIEPMQWNTQGIWFNLFVYYRGSFKLSVRTRVLMQKLINYDPKKHKPIFAQHHSAQLVHKDDERIDEDDLVQRQKLLAKEPEVPEMAVTRKVGLSLTNLALNKYFQMFANIPFVKTLFEKFSEKEVGADVEVTGFSGILTLNIPPPPSDRIWVGFPEMPDLSIKVVPVYGENQYAYTLLQEFLTARVRAELKRLVVLPAMDDQLLPFFRDWAIDIIGEIVSKPINPLTDNFRAKLNAQASVRAGLEDYNSKAPRDRAGSASITALADTTHL